MTRNESEESAGKGKSSSPWATFTAWVAPTARNMGIWSGLYLPACSLV